MTTTVFADPISNLGFKYINDIVVSNNATTPNTKLDITAGICRDSTNQVDIILGNYLGDTSLQTSANVTTTLNAAVNGANGLDTGSLGASKVYAIYAISDAQKINPTATIASLSLTGPQMPTGYAFWRLIGYAVTDSSSHFLKAYTSGTNATRLFMYDAPIATATTASSASYAAVDLTKFVPLINNTPVIVNASISGTAGDTLKLQPGNATGDAVVVTAQVNSQAVTQQVLVLAQNTVISTVNSPTINYKNSGTDTIVLNIAGFYFYV